MIDVQQWMTIEHIDRYKNVDLPIYIVCVTDDVVNINDSNIIVYAMNLREYLLDFFMSLMYSSHSC